MVPWMRFALFGGVAVASFDVIAAGASRMTGIPYAWATVGSWLLYAGIGFLAARATPDSPLRVAALAGLILGLVDVSLGWAASWAIGPGRLAGGLTAARWLVTAIFVAALATGVATLGGLAGRSGRGPDRAAV
jgi:hypothetical protein